MIGSRYSRIPKKHKIAGVRSVSKALENGLVAKIFVAEDAKKDVVTDVLSRAEALNVEIIWVPSMRQLGEFCGINVGASCCALLKSYTKETGKGG